jgi:hypothetical protein
MRGERAVGDDRSGIGTRNSLKKGLFLPHPNEASPQTDEVYRHNMS